MADPSGSGGMRSVVRAACLNCRSAKRRCDGQQPVCGPCMSRGIEEGGCNFVSSKRGGPRYKGVRGAEAAKLKAEREHEREETRAHRDVGRSGSSSKRDRDSLHRAGTNSQSDHSSPDQHRAGPESGSPDPYYGHQHGYAPSHYQSNDGSAPRIMSRRSYIEQGSSSASAMGPSHAFAGPRPTGHQRGSSYTGPGASVVPLGSQPLADPYVAALQQTQGLFPEQQLHYQLLAQQNQQMILQQTAPLSPHQPPQVNPLPQHSTSPMGSTLAVHRPVQQGAGASIQHMPFSASSADHMSQRANHDVAHTQAPTQAAQASLNALLGIDYNDIVSLANLEVSPAHGRHSSASTNAGLAGHEDAALGFGGAQEFNEFLANLELLPKAGNVGACGDGPSDPLEVLMDWEGGEVGHNVQDNEQGARTLLTDFYNLVYPSCPVLPSPGSLPSLAFYFSGKGPCGLFAALSAVVALHLTSEEALRTLKASQHPLQRYEACSRTSDGDEAELAPEKKSAEDVAAYHARTSEYILHQWEEKQRTCFMDLSAANPFDGLDEELITIEAGAAHTLLCHYHYGSNKPLSHQRAYKHAVEAWNLMQRLDIPSRTTWQQDGSERANSARPFNADLKLEWAKRVYWASYASATVMSCTGGFEPFGSLRDGVMDLKLRPSLDHDISAWSVMVRGAQQVSKCYRLLYELDQLRSRISERETQLSPAEMQQLAAERQNIFSAMLKLDAEISTYTRFDAGWRDVTQIALHETARTPGGSAWPSMPGAAPSTTGDHIVLKDPLSSPQAEEISASDRELARSLKVAGRLMTSGAIILLHRGQAFSNARVFMAPQCGVPQATRASKMRRMEPLVHRDGTKLDEDSEAKHDFAGVSASSRNGSSLTSHSIESHSTTTSSSNGSFANDQSFLTDRYAGGPFEPSHSLERCRFAASTMVSTLPRVLQDYGRASKLPPYSACSYVLGAYAILMLTLLLQVRSDRALQQQQMARHERQRSDASDAATSSDSAVQARKSMLRGQLETQRAPVRDMIAVLSKFAIVWPKAVEYAREVSTLLQANETIG